MGLGTRRWLNKLMRNPARVKVVKEEDGFVENP
jgi:hypothetical protein